VKDTEFIKLDIMDNLENIVKMMDLEPFKIILMKYNEKVQLLDENIN
jgi:hypothetical protein